MYKVLAPLPHMLEFDVLFVLCLRVLVSGAVQGIMPQHYRPALIAFEDLFIMRTPMPHMPQPNLPVHILLTIILLIPTPQPMLPSNIMPRQHLPPQPSNPNLPTLPTPMLDLLHYRHPMPYLLIDLLPIRQPMPFLMPSRVLFCQCPLSELSNLMFYVYECGQLYGMCSWVLLVCG